MLKKENIICISSIDWDFVWQGHQEIMSTFAENGNRILFIENTGVRTPNIQDFGRLKNRVLNWLKGIKGFREERKNLYVYSPVILPFPYSKIARWFNKRLLLGPLKKWINATDFDEPIIWTFLPTGTALDIIDNLDNKLLIYYCIADFYKLVADERKIQKTEDALIKKCDLIFAQGQALKDRCARYNNNVHIFPFGVNTDIFDNSKYLHSEMPDDLRNIKKPIIGYIGGIHKHIDFKLINFISRTYPDWSFVFVGPLQIDVSEINNLKNVYFLGKKDITSLARYLSQFDVGIIPYKINDYTKTVFPTKLNEYCSLGKPVVSTSLPEVVYFNKENSNLISVAETYEQFGSLLDHSIKCDSDKLRSNRLLLAIKNNWGTRIEEMCSLIESSLRYKEKKVLDWKTKLLSLYSVTKRKLLRLCFTLFVLCLVLFYTPLFWLIGEPLKVSQPPQKADCIVVFAGGVGESGKAGQGYEERVYQAVELYKKGYADKLIFSTGYVYFLKETQVMKSVAVSLGVSGEAIILEDKAASAYENVMFSKRILDKRNMNSILLVSSPYNMRRILLVFNKSAKGIKVICSPVPNSMFFTHPHKWWVKISPEQIRGILHEYLGILFYWWKGWL